MRQWLLLIVFLNCFAAHSQTFTVGSTCCNYFFANKTFTTPTTYGFYNDFFYIDIDGDLNDDIGIRSQHYSCQPTPSGPCTGQWGNDITITLANNVSFVYGPATVSCSVLNTIKNLVYGSPLNSSLNWSVTSAPNSGPLVFSAGVGYSCGQSVNPFYVGFRKIVPFNDTIYGWLRLDSNFPGKVIDYGYRHTGSITNMAEAMNPNFAVLLIYPNPASDILLIETESNANVEMNILTIDGRKIKTLSLINKKTEIDLSEISQGIYFIVIGNGKDSFRKRLIISR